ncbi:hypothetical protein Tco_0995140 [Tanacetum coccineum]
MLSHGACTPTTLLVRKDSGKCREEEEGYTWITPLLDYLEDGTLPMEVKKARALKIGSRQYDVVNGSAMHKDARNVIQKCQDYHRPIPKNPRYKLTLVTSPLPFYKWGVDISGPFPKAPEEKRERAANNDASHAEDTSKLSLKWEGPYKVVEALKKRAYKLRNGGGDILPRTWNVWNLKKCYT